MSNHWCTATATCVPSGLVNTKTSPGTALSGLKKGQVSIMVLPLTRKNTTLGSKSLFLHDKLVGLTDCCCYSSHHDPGIENGLTSCYRCARLLWRVLKSLNDQWDDFVSFLKTQRVVNKDPENNICYLYLKELYC